MTFTLRWVASLHERPSRLAGVATSIQPGRLARLARRAQRWGRR